MSPIDFLNDLTVDEAAKAYADELRFSFLIAEQCEDPNDVAESALWLIARKIDADAKHHREQLSLRGVYMDEWQRVDHAGSAAELEALSRRIRAVLKPAPELRTAA